MKNKARIYIALEDKDREGELRRILPEASICKANARRGRAAVLTALGELLRIRMMRDAGVGFEVAVGAHGKPYQPEHPDVAFSVSHSGSAAAGALLTGGVGDIGVDIERIGRADDVRRERIAAKFFTDGERRAIIDGAYDPETSFYVIWTRKEAYLKYTGDGFSRAAATVDTTSEIEGCKIYTRIIETDGERYALSAAAPAAAVVDMDKIETVTY